MGRHVLKVHTRQIETEIAETVSFNTLALQVIDQDPLEEGVLSLNVQDCFGPASSKHEKPGFISPLLSVNVHDLLESMFQLSYPEKLPSCLSSVFDILRSVLRPIDKRKMLL